MYINLINNNILIRLSSVWKKRVHGLLKKRVHILRMSVIFQLYLCILRMQVIL